MTATIDLDDLKTVKVSVCGAGHYARSEILSLVIDDEPKLRPSAGATESLTAARS